MKKLFFIALLILGTIHLNTNAQTSADVAEVLKLSVDNDVVASYFKNKVHIAKNEVLTKKNLNDELKKRDLRLSSKFDMKAAFVKQAVEIESITVNPTKAKVVYSLDTHQFKCTLKKKDNQWVLKKSKQI